jgi:hypothetical protein
LDRSQPIEHKLVQGTLLGKARERTMERFVVVVVGYQVNTYLVTDLASLECSFSLAPAPAKAELC